MANKAFIKLVYGVVAENGYNTEDMPFTQALKIFQDLGGENNWSAKTKDFGSVLNPMKNEKYVETIDIENEDELQSTIRKYEDKISNENIEHNIVIDEDGHVYENIGTYDYVEAIDTDLTNAIDIHNHPSGGTFSKDDFVAIKENPSTTFIVSTDKNIYKIKTLKEIDKPYSYFYTNADNRPLNEMIGENDFDIDEATVLKMQEEGYIKYDKFNRDSRVEEIT